MQKKDYYKVLGLDSTATQKEIKKAFRKAAMKYHPDKNDSPEAEDLFKQINEANEVLSDPVKRDKYNRFGHSAFVQNGQTSSTYSNNGAFNFGKGFEDIFGSFFTQKDFDSSPKKGVNLNSYVSISLKDSFFGTILSENLIKYVNNVQEQKQVEITIPKGIKHNQVLTLKGFGKPGTNGGPNGDLLLKIIIKKHPFFTREEDNLVIEVPVSFLDIMLENDIKVPTLKKGSFKTITLKNTYHSNTTLTISGLGFETKTSLGNLLVKLKLFSPPIPKKLLKDFTKLNSKFSNEEYTTWLKQF